MFVGITLCAFAFGPFPSSDLVQVLLQLTLVAQHGDHDIRIASDLTLLFQCMLFASRAGQSIKSSF